MIVPGSFIDDRCPIADRCALFWDLAPVPHLNHITVIHNQYIINQINKEQKWTMSCAVFSSQAETNMLTWFYITGPIIHYAHNLNTDCTRQAGPLDLGQIQLPDQTARTCHRIGSHGMILDEDQENHTM